MVYGSDKLIRCCRTAAAVVNGITTILVHGKIGVSRVELIPTQIMIYLSNALLMHVTEYRSGQSSAQIGDTPAGINQSPLIDPSQAYGDQFAFNSLPLMCPLCVCTSASLTRYFEVCFTARHPMAPLGNNPLS